MNSTNGTNGTNESNAAISRIVNLWASENKARIVKDRKLDATQREGVSAYLLALLANYTPTAGVDLVRSLAEITGGAAIAEALNAQLDQLDSANGSLFDNAAAHKMTCRLAGIAYVPDSQDAAGEVVRGSSELIEQVVESVDGGFRFNAAGKSTKASNVISRGENKAARQARETREGAVKTMGEADEETPKLPEKQSKQDTFLFCFYNNREEDPREMIGRIRKLMETAETLPQYIIP